MKVKGGGDLDTEKPDHWAETVHRYYIYGNSVGHWIVWM